jgi:hypothetical protein
MNNFYVGQEVVCIDAKNHSMDKEWIFEGTHYIIRWLGMYPILIVGGHFLPKTEIVCVRLRNVTRPFTKLPNDIDTSGYPEDFFWDVPFAAVRFKPVEKKETDISVFNEILTKAKVPELT